jgi:hypothetical protein
VRILGLTLISLYELKFCLFVSLANCETCKLQDSQVHNISHFSLLLRLVRIARLTLIFTRELSFIFYKILARKIAKRDSLTTLSLTIFLPWLHMYLRQSMTYIVLVCFLQQHQRPLFGERACYGQHVLCMTDKSNRFTVTLGKNIYFH